MTGSHAMQCLALAFGLALAFFETGETDLPLRATDLAGQPVELDPSASDALVLLFVAWDCPISNRYAPTINRLALELGGRGVRFVLVYSDPAVPAEQLRAHHAEFALAPPALRDSEQLLRRRTGVTTNPEAALLDRAGRLRYRGRIDDRYLDFGKVRPAATREDLRLALQSVLAGRPVEQPRTPAVGCYLPDA